MNKDKHLIKNTKSTKGKNALWSIILRCEKVPRAWAGLTQVMSKNKCKLYPVLKVKNNRLLKFPVMNDYWNILKDYHKTSVSEAIRNSV